jgi:hypothetical protein
MRRYALGCALLLLLAVIGFCLLGAFVAPPAGAGALATPVEVTNWPTPVPTAVPLPTACVTSTAVAPVCGVAAVNVGTAHGGGGVLMALLIVNVLGFGFLAVVQFVRGVTR